MHEPMLYDPAPPASVSQEQRMLSLLGGLGLLTLALTRRDLLSLPAFLAGAGLFYRGATGNSPLALGEKQPTAGRGRSSRVSVPQQKGIHATRSVTIKRSAEDLYNFWHEPANLPEVIGYVESVQVTGDKRAHWTVKAPGGATVEFDVEVYTDTPNEVISWRSLPESDLQNAGSVRFRPAPADRGTEVTLTVEFVPPGGAIGQALLKMFGDVPNQYVGQYLREFKQMMETGEKATTQGQTSGRKQEVQQ